MKLIKFLFSFLLVSSSCAGQIRMPYSIGCVGNTNLKQPVYSSSVVINGKACFILSNGIRTFQNSGSLLLFTTSCEVQHAIGELVRFDLFAYPNPVNTIVNIRSLKLVETAGMFLFNVYSVTGQLVKTISISPQELNAGFTIDMSGLAGGAYIVKATSLKASAEIKLIKTN